MVSPRTYIFYHVGHTLQKLTFLLALYLMLCHARLVDLRGDPLEVLAKVQQCVMSYFSAPKDEELWRQHQHVLRELTQAYYISTL